LIRTNSILYYQRIDTVEPPSFRRWEISTAVLEVLKDNTIPVREPVFFPARRITRLTDSIFANTLNTLLAEAKRFARSGKKPEKWVSS
jgi:hypothetical protein